MANKKYSKLVGLGVIALVATSVFGYTVYAASSQNSAYNGNLNFTADANVSARIEVSINGVKDDTLTHEFVKNEVSTTKDSAIALGEWVDTVENNLLSKSSEVLFRIINTSQVYAFNLQTTYNETLDNVITKGAQLSKVESTIAVGGQTSFKYVYSVVDLDLNASISASWGFALTAIAN
ncbi:MAG TPA: hypothetical protein VJY64_00115 [Candidatus Onthovivens sp.]|nr:hypothetical protein [Candidatus Onthovivens sp.]